MSDAATRVPGAVTLVGADLNPQGGIHCPHPKADMALWNSHPKVFLQIAQTGEGRCPYCGTAYHLTGGAAGASGH